jgi:methyltransferase
MTAALILLAAVAAERLAELWLARRNTIALIAEGACEIAPEHYPAIVVLHAAWLAALILCGWRNSLDPAWFTIFFALQGLRAWTLATLGRRWTTRILVVPGAALIANGPYRFLAHPNYLVVVGEIAALPLCLGLPRLALFFTLANAVLLSIRISAEDAALAGLRRADPV